MNRFYSKMKYGELFWEIKKNDFKEFYSSLEGQQWGIQYYSNWAKRYVFTMNAATAVQQGCYTYPVEYYCGYGYQNINSILRDSEKPCMKEAFAACRALLLVLCSAPRIPENVIVYRVASDEFIAEMICRNKDRKPMQEKGFLSTSMTKTIAMHPEHLGSKYLLKIFVPKGAIGIYVNVIAQRDENELLLISGQYLGMIAYPYYDKTIRKTIFECKLLNTF